MTLLATARACLLLVTIGVLAAGCHSNDREVVVYSSVDRVFAAPVLRDFESVSGIRVRALYDTEETKSTGVLNRIIAEAAQPQADVFWSGDPMRPFQLIRRDLVVPYTPKNAVALPPHGKDSKGRWTGVSARARVILVNTNRVKENPPSGVRDLIDERWRNQAAIANPLFGTTTMHVAALFFAWGDDEAKKFLTAAKSNGIKIVSSNGEVKRLVASGEVAWGITDSDDAADSISNGDPVAVVFPDQSKLGALVMPTTVVMIRGAAHADQAHALLDYLVSTQVEEKLAKNGAHLPLQPGVKSSASISIPSNFRAMHVDYDQLAATIERIQPWLREWVGL
jgi:iron(III) transport system substrate-binding protein